MAFPKQLLISYVEGLKLVPFDKDALVTAPNVLDDKDAASVVGSLAVGFLEGLDTQHKADIQNSMLFAQLAANAKYNKTDQAGEWYGFYKDVVENIGWESHAFEWDVIEDASSFGSVDKLVLALAAKYPPDEFKLLGGMINALSHTANAGAQKILDDSSIGNHKANFQLAIGGASGGNAVLKLLGNVYSTQGEIIHVLFTKFTGQLVKYDACSQSMTLDDRVYSTIRQTIIDKLGDAVTQCIADIELNPTV